MLERTKRLIRALAFSGGLLLIWTAFAAGLATFLVVSQPIGYVDAIIILGGSAAAEERTLEAAEAYRRGTGGRILISNDGLAGGWDNEQRRNPLFAERSRGLLERSGVPADAIEILSETVENTHDEADLIARVSIERQFRSVLLVTSDYHTRRALQSLRRALDRHKFHLEVGIQGAKSPSNLASPYWWWLHVAGWKTVGLETGKLLFYYCRY